MKLKISLTSVKGQMFFLIIKWSYGNCHIEETWALAFDLIAADKRKETWDFNLTAADKRVQTWVFFVFAVLHILIAENGINYYQGYYGDEELA